ncbi:MAG: DNA-binding response regulator [Spirochaetaceae bacterium]|nr:MAG: DNA-binding response regulator [Spirochaetaceae bacterium]
MRIIIVTAHLSRGLVESAFSAGADGYLSKESAGLYLIEAVHAVMRGERFCGPKAMQHLDPPNDSEDHTSDNTGDQAIARYSSLSLREQQVLRLLVTGTPSSDIARALSISRKTVDVHRSNIYRKLGVDNPLQVWRLAVRLGITEDR